MPETKVRLTREGTWGVWVGKTCIGNEFVSAQAAWNCAEGHVPGCKPKHDGRVNPEQRAYPAEQQSGQAKPHN